MEFILIIIVKVATTYWNTEATLAGCSFARHHWLLVEIEHARSAWLRVYHLDYWTTATARVQRRLERIGWGWPFKTMVKWHKWSLRALSSTASTVKLICSLWRKAKMEMSPVWGKVTESALFFYKSGPIFNIMHYASLTEDSCSSKNSLIRSAVSDQRTEQNSNIQTS